MNTTDGRAEGRQLHCWNDCRGCLWPRFGGSASSLLSHLVLKGKLPPLAWGRGRMGELWKLRCSGPLEGQGKVKALWLALGRSSVKDLQSQKSES